MPTFDKSFKMNHTCLRIKDPKVLIPFYENNFGMKLLTKFDFPSMKFTIYMLAYNTPETKGKNWADREGVLELCHNYGTENDPNFKVNNGNGEKDRGFGHICLSVDNIEVAELKLLTNGVQFQKKLSDGRQRNIAFALDPDGYWIELIENGINKQEKETDYSNYRFNHTMIRVKDPKKSLEFYENVLGMKVLTKKSFEEAKFTLYFLGYNHENVDHEGNRQAQAGRQGIIELTHNWGTEDDDDFSYHNGNSTDHGAIQGYGHTCVSCADPAKLCEQIEQQYGDKIQWGVKFNQGTIKKIAFIKDPDNYSIEIIPSSMFENGSANYDKL